METEANQTSPVPARKRARRTGIVLKAKMQKSVVVGVERVVIHPLYKRTMRRTTRLMAHDAEGRCRLGDRVVIEECRPLSKNKRWIVKEVIAAAAARKGASG